MEALFNIGSGFLISWGVWHFVIPALFGKPDPTDGVQGFLLTCVFTITSLVRSYLWRRFFNNRNVVEGEHIAQMEDGTWHPGQPL